MVYIIAYREDIHNHTSEMEVQFLKAFIIISLK